MDPGVPRCSRFHHRMQDGEKLAHGGCNGHFLRFPARQQPVIEGIDDRVTPRGGEGGHVQDRADLRTATAAMTCSRPLAAIVIEGGDAHQLGDFALVEDP